MVCPKRYDSEGRRLVIDRTGKLSYIFVIFTIYGCNCIHAKVVTYCLMLDKSPLKWYYALFSLKKLGCNCYIFQKIAIYDGE